MKNILAVDTATKNLYITVKKDKEIFTNTIDEGYAHSENLLPYIMKLLTKVELELNDLDLLVCTRGPGSFTGLRISMATLKGLSIGLNTPLVTIPTLDVYAFNHKKFSGIVLPIIDARKKCFYTALFKDGIKKTSDLDISIDEIIELTDKEKSILLVGPDCRILFDKIPEQSKFILDLDSYKKISNSLIELGINQFKKNGPDSENQGPVYIRKSEAEINLNRN